MIMKQDGGRLVMKAEDAVDVELINFIFQGIADGSLYKHFNGAAYQAMVEESRRTVAEHYAELSKETES